MKRLLILAMVLSTFLIAVPVSADPGTLYVDDDGVCGGNSPCYTTIQAAINAASPSDTILVYPGTYGKIPICPPGWWCAPGGSYFAPPAVVYKDNLTIQAIDPNPANTVIVNDAAGWSGGYVVYYSTGTAVNPAGPSIWDGTVAPNAVVIIANGVTIEGFTINSTYIGDPGQTWHPNTAGVFVGGLYAGDLQFEGKGGATIKNNTASGWDAIRLWKSPGNTIDGNVLSNIPPTTAPKGAGISVWDGWIEGNPAISSTGTQILGNTITTISGSDGVFFGGVTSTSPWTGVDHSNLYIDGNTINSGGHGVTFWGSFGTNKVMTCNNTVTVPTGYMHVGVWWGTYDGPYGLDTDGDGIPDCNDIEIDIKPGSYPNSINPNSKGVIPVAILGSASFDVTDVDVTSLEFGPNGAAPVHDLTDPDVYAEHLQDVNGDGFVDLVSHYRTQDTGIVAGDTVACLTGGKTTDPLNDTIQGCDTIRTVGK